MRQDLVRFGWISCRSKELKATSGFACNNRYMLGNFDMVGFDLVIDIPASSKFESMLVSLSTCQLEKRGSYKCKSRLFTVISTTSLIAPSYYLLPYR